MDVLSYTHDLCPFSISYRCHRLSMEVVCYLCNYDEAIIKTNGLLRTTAPHSDHRGKDCQHSEDDNVYEESGGHGSDSAGQPEGSPWPKQRSSKYQSRNTTDIIDRYKIRGDVLRRKDDLFK